MNRIMIANELVKIAKLLQGFWDLKIVPPTSAGSPPSHAAMRSRYSASESEATRTETL